MTKKDHLPLSPDEWPREPFGDEYTTVDFSGTYTREEMERVRRGSFPEKLTGVIADFEDDTLHCYRCYSSVALYQVRFGELSEGTSEIVEVLMSSGKKALSDGSTPDIDIPLIVESTLIDDVEDIDWPQVRAVPEFYRRAGRKGSRLLHRRQLVPGFIEESERFGVRRNAVDYADKYAGALLGGACGQALWHSRAEQDPADSDAMQQTIALAQSISDTGTVDPGDFARRLAERSLKPTNSGTKADLMAGIPWYERSQNASDPVVAIRVAPVALLDPLDLNLLRLDAALSAAVTHTHPMASAAAIAQAFAVVYCLHQDPTRFDPFELAGSLAIVLSDVHDPGEPDLRPSVPLRERVKTVRLPQGRQIRLADRIQDAFRLHDSSAEGAFANLQPGRFVIESLPAAIWCLAAHHDDPERAMSTAADRGHEADGVASMVGNMIGALHGVSALPDEWLGHVKHRDELTVLAEELHGMWF